MRRFSFVPRVWLSAAGLSLLVVLATSPAAVSHVAAQSGADAWSTPINLSQSGVATDPALIVDSTAVVHALWQDTFGVFTYVRMEDGRWGVPQETDLNILFGSPASEQADVDSAARLYTGPNPYFVAGARSFSLALWISPQGTLYASRAPNQSLADVGAWTRRNPLSSSVATFAAATDALGTVHVAFLRTTSISGAPAGIYYVRSRNDGLDWSVPALVYGSSYFRRLAEGEANLSMAAAGTAEAPLVYIAWDDRPRKQVLLARSADGGANWDPSVQVAGPQRNSGVAGPYSIQVGATEHQAVLLWQDGAPTGSCTAWYRYSVDSGTTWSEALLMGDALPGCAEATAFVSGQQGGPDGYLYLLSDLKSQVYLSAWNGTQWSEPQLQPVLSGFEDPEIFTEVALGCRQAAWVEDSLYTIGCDLGGGGDIWVTSREVESAPDWFSPPTWGRPAAVRSESYKLADLELVGTGDNLTHAFFSQHQDAAIYYTRWDGATWARVTPVVSLPEGEAGWPTITTGPNNALFLVVQSSTGLLYYSRTTSSSALTAAGWSPPTRLRIAQDAKVSAADVVWDGSGTVSIVYAVPVNEGRGIYLTQSKDGGRTWSAAVKVFDGAAAPADIVGAPSLLIADKGVLHVIWKVEVLGLGGQVQPVALYYARSDDAGKTFSQARRVTEAPVGWAEMIADGEGRLHRLWRPLDQQTTVWDEISADGGLTWQTAQRLPVQAGAVAVAADATGRLHIVDAGPDTLGHRLWSGGRWQAQASLRWAAAAPQAPPADLLSIAARPDGMLTVVWAVPPDAHDSVTRQLLYANRTFDLAGRSGVDAVTAAGARVRWSWFGR